MSAVLSVKGLNKVYQNGSDNQQHILKDIDLEVGRGEFIAVMGQSGSGKSTLLYNISGMDRLTSGQVFFDGQELGGRSESELAALRLNKMGFIFQQSNLLKNLSILDNIMLASYLRKKESRRTIQNRARNLMKHTGILSLADHDITQASGGQLQRASICRALLNSPEILFGDEPTGALNSGATGEVMDILASVNEAGTTIVLVTHDAKVAARTERVIFMADGVIAGEKRLGKYDHRSGDKNEREAELAEWLAVHGF